MKTMQQIPGSAGASRDMIGVFDGAPKTAGEAPALPTKDSLNEESL